MATVQEQPRTGSDRRIPVEFTQQTPEQREEIRRSAEIVAGGFSSEAFAAAGAVVLAILGLTDMLPLAMAAIAVIAISVALLMKAGSVAARFSKLSYETGGTPGSEVELGAGMSAELTAGVAGLALGVLSLIGVVPMFLLPAAALLFGGAMLLGGGETYRVSRLARFEGTRQADFASRTVGQSAGGAETLVGIGAIVLGILALTGPQTLTLVLVAFLAVGSIQLLSGIAESGLMTMLLRSH